MPLQNKKSTTSMPSTPSTEHSASLSSANWLLGMQWPSTIICKYQGMKTPIFKRSLVHSASGYTLKLWYYFQHFHVTTIRRWYIENISDIKITSVWKTKSTGNMSWLKRKKQVNSYDNVLWNFLFYTDHLLLGQKVMTEIRWQQKCWYI
jgi:hypothetical protein